MIKIMNKIKKTILTLALLMTAATGAWAQGPVDGTIAWPVGNEASATVSASIKDAISSTGVTTGSGLTVNTGKYFNTDMVRYQPATTNAGNVEGVMIEYTIEAVDGYKFKPTGVDYAAVKDGADNASYSWSYTIDGVESAITDVSNTSVLRNNGSNSGTAQLMHNESITADGCSVFTLRFYISNCGNTKKIGIANITISGSVSAASAASGPEVAWDKAAKTGSFTMPGGNVTLEPEYYPQATVAEGAVTAADADARATTDDPLVKVDATKLTGAKKLMYFVSNSGTTAPAYDAEGWTDQLPTAEGFTQQGIVYVWYYPVGTDEGVDGATATYSDGDICLQSITARIAAEPTYTVTFAEGTEDAGKWTIDPTEAAEGSPVTVTYGGDRKVKSVKAVKKAAAPSLNITSPEVGQVIGSDGKNYAYGSLPTGVTAVAKICYVSGSNGLALALTDEEGKMNWSTAIETCAAHTPAFTGGTWKLASKDEWSNMISAAGSYTNLRNGFSSVGGTNMQEDTYWSSTERDSDDSQAWVYFFNFIGNWSFGNKEANAGYVRPCLAF